VEFTRSEPTFGTHTIPMPEQVAVTPAYNPKATILVRKGYYYGTPSDSKFEVENADDISRTYWQKDALKETNDRNSRALDKVKDYLVENYEEIGEEHSNEIARILSIDLHKTVDVVFDVTIRATVSVPVDKDVEDLSVYDFDIEISSNESDYEIEESEADIDSIRNYF
jgi:hypothetical protein